MAQFYRVKTAGKPDALFDASNNKQIADVNALKAGGYQEIVAPTPKAGSTAIPDPTAIKDYDVTNQVGGTLYGIPKTPTSSDISAGLNLSGVKPPATTAGIIHETFANNASQYSQSQKDMIKIREQQLAETQKQMADVNKQIADNQAKIDQNAATAKDVYTGSMDDQNLQGWRQQAIGVNSDELKSKYADYKTEYESRKSMGDELSQLASMYSNELSKPQVISDYTTMQGRLNNTKEQYAGRISALQAGISALDGNISMAKTFIDRGIDTVNSDRTDRLNYLNFVQGLATTKGTELKTSLLNLTKDEKTTIDNEIKIIQDKITETENNKKFMQTLFVDTQTAQTAIKSGVTLTDTPDQAVKKMADYMKTHPNEFDNGKVTYGIIGQDENGNNIYGFIDTGTKTVSSQTSNNTNNNSSGGIVKTSTGDAYDIGSYATDPNHETSIQNILNSIGQFKTVSDIDNYIKKIVPNSPITGAMVQSAANKYGVSWEMMVAIMQQDSSLGTAGKGARTFNPGNVGNTDSGTEVNYGNWQTGVDAVAKNLAGRKTTANTNKTTTPEGYDISKFTQKFYNTNQGQKVLNNEQQYQTNFMTQQAVKDFLVVQNKASSIELIIKAGVGGPGDLAIVYEFMKSLDPTSVVRETEYESAAKSGNIFLGAYAKFNGYLKEEGGILPDNVKQSFLDITNKKLEVGLKTYNQIRNQYRKNAYEQGLNPDHVAPDLVINKLKVDNNSINNNLNNTSNSTPMIENQKGFWSKVGNWLWGD